MTTKRLKLDDIEASLLSGIFKGFPPAEAPMPLRDVGDKGWNILREDVPLPVAVLRETVLNRNRAWMQAFLSRCGASLCPHGKTSMSPQLFERQLADGAWGITAATINHLRVYRRHGVSRVLFANQLLGRRSIQYVLQQVRDDPDFDFYCLLDSAENLEMLAREARDARMDRPLQVLLEMGAPGGRTGVRTPTEALHLARQVRAAGPAVALRGAEAFEGLWAPAADTSRANVEELLDRVIEVARACEAESLFGEGEVILTAGGSVYFDVVANRLGAAGLHTATRVVLRSGCYLTHDTGLYSEAREVLLERSPELRDLPGDLSAALELWTYVQSRPEDGLAIASIGKRDASHDIALPTPRRVYRPGRDAAPIDLPGGYEVVSLNDHHAYLDLPPSSDLAVGDLLSFETAHPCTTFDRWPLIYMVDEDLNVRSAIRTFF